MNELRVLRSPRRVRCVNATVCLLSLSSLAACGHIHPADVTMATNPPAPPGYQASCSSLPLPLNAFITFCAPDHSDQVAVVQAKG
jgi:hypothetical protein